MAALILLGIMALYWVALINARHQYRALRTQFCTRLVVDFHQRNHQLRRLALVDPCLEWEQLSGEVIR